MLVLCFLPVFLLYPSESGCGKKSLLKQPMVNNYTMPAIKQDKTECYKHVNPASVGDIHEKPVPDKANADETNQRYGSRRNKANQTKAPLTIRV